MSKKNKLILIIIFSIVIFLLAVGIGSVYISPRIIIKVIIEKATGYKFIINPVQEVIIWKIRLPRAILAFICGSGLAVSGVVMQSILRNPLASSYTLGVSSGAAVGASIAIVYQLSFLGMFTIPFIGLSFGIITVFLAMLISTKMDKNINNTTIILTGMAISLFANSILTFIIGMFRESADKLIFWQLGSFSMKEWKTPLILSPIIFIGTIIILFFVREMDIMTFGEEQAKASGVSVVKIKWILISISAILTGSIVSMVGIIGFVDLFTPHVARKFFGSKHKYVIPVSAILGGSFMVLCDLISRVVLSPIEIPIGSVTSAIGAPFFMYLYFNGRKR